MPVRQMETNGFADGTLTASQSMDSVHMMPDDEQHRCPKTPIDEKQDESFLYFVCFDKEREILVRTLFVSGLPADTKPRELYLLFRAYKGYESSLLKVTSKNGKSSSPVGFVTFSDRPSAELARKDLQGVKFDPDLTQPLRLEFAKSNTKVTNNKIKQISPPIAATLPTFLHPLSGPELLALQQHNSNELWNNSLAAYAAELNAANFQIHPILQTLQTAALPGQYPFGSLAAATAGHPAFFGGGMPAVVPSFTAAAAAAAQQSTAANNVTAALAAALAANGTVNGQSTPVPFSNAASMAPPLGPTTLTNGHSSVTLLNSQHLQPCSTLFVANLGPNVDERELRDVFSVFPGFSRFRFHNKSGSPVAFVEYTEIRHAAQAMASLQGFTLPSSDRGGIRIEYAKHKMGESRKDEHFSSQSPITLTYDVMTSAISVLFLKP
uniref:RRM domain-containing protein n=1 Tax=Romanomermis culicivorax TaxID=13658 RepID=A0A915JUG5_ROMCU